MSGCFNKCLVGKLFKKFLESHKEMHSRRNIFIRINTFQNISEKGALGMLMKSILLEKISHLLFEFQEKFFFLDK